MHIRRIDAATIALEEIDAFCLALLRSIPERTQSGDDPAVEARLFTSPTHGVDLEADSDWREYVEPELRQLFQGAVDVVKRDLEATESEEEDSSILQLPIAHLEAWIHALNQARLALAARFGFTEADMEGRFVLDADPRSRALFEVRFYGLLQEFFLGQLEAEPE